MGVHVKLDIDPGGIDAAVWAEVYDETLRLLKAWPERLVGWRWKTVEGLRVPMYARSLARRRRDPARTYWAVTGDRVTLRTGECQEMHRALEHYGAPGAACDDILLYAARRDDGSGGPVNVFGRKTQGHSFHFAVLAAAMLVEERFPKHAMVRGDIDRGQAEAARRMAEPILGRPLPLPVRVDAPRLIERLRAGFHRDALMWAFELTYLDDSTARHEAVLRAFEGDAGERWWVESYKRFASHRSLGAIDLLIAWFNAERDLATAARLVCCDERGPRHAPSDFLDALLSTWVTLPPTSRAPFAPLLRPEGAAHTVFGLLGGFIFDQSIAGRKSRCWLQPEAVEAGLRDAFGDAAEALCADLRARSATELARLDREAEGARALVERGNARFVDDPDEVPEVRSPAKLGARQREVLEALAWRVERSLAGLRRDASKLAVDLGAPGDVRCLVARMLADGGPTLTERAWTEILASEDADELCWLFVLAGFRAPNDALARTQVALFERPRLRAYARAVGRDPARMAAIDARLKALPTA